MNIETIVEKQREFFKTGETQTKFYRNLMLQKLRNAIIKYKPQIISALETDLGKGQIESILTEIWVVLSEIRYHQRHLKNWMKKRKVHTPVILFPGKSYLLHSPLGVNLIISPWNYPFQLSIMPLIGAISAGNTAVIKPSEFSPATSTIIKLICEEIFPPEYVSVFLGDENVAKTLLNQDFDHIFFTGSSKVGSIIQEKASKNLAKVTLELGGKSPVIVDNLARLDWAGKRIVFGKILNAGQTCIAPDYVICHEKRYEGLLKALKEYIKEQLGENPIANPDYPRIINEKHFNRLVALLEDEETEIGGYYDKETLKITPTVVRIKDLNRPLMKEEIFGPILPILTFRDEEEIETIISKNPNPLAFYVFSQNQFFIDRMIRKFSFGGASINDTLSHLIPHQLPFGGVKTSGIGQYHGYASFQVFSHQKSIYQIMKGNELKMKYPPYTDRVKKLINKYFTK